MTRSGRGLACVGSCYGAGGAGYIEDTQDESLVESLKARTCDVVDAPEAAHFDTAKTNPVRVGSWDPRESCICRRRGRDALRFTLEQTDKLASCATACVVGPLHRSVRPRNEFARHE
jgi:hypothetical protein